MQPDLGHILHTRHQYHWHTGYVPPQTVAAPHLGRVDGRRCSGRGIPVMPAFIDIGQRLEGHGEKEELKAFHTAGFFGGEYGPFMLPYPAGRGRRRAAAQGMTPERFEARYKQYRELVLRGPLGEHGSDYQQESMIRGDGERLSPAQFARAGGVRSAPTSRSRVTTSTTTGQFGLGCLLARRLVEAGTRFIEVTTEYVPFEGWDTHEEGHTRGGEDEAVDRPADRAADRRPGAARPVGPHAGDRGQRVQPRHDDRRRPRQHGEGSVAGR